jgi:hypothetical protein
MLRLATLAALLAVAAGAPPRARWTGETRVVPPLADPRAVPGVARCTSDRACTVTDGGGTRAAVPVFPR